jgi:predicted transcriptional regulator
MADHGQLLTLTTEIVSAHVSNNTTPPDQLPALIQRVFTTLATVEQKAGEPPKPNPAVPIKQSVRQDHLVCLECGKHFSMLKRHLSSDRQLTPEQYRQHWSLPPSYPIVAPNYAKVRSALAKKIGLGKTQAPAVNKISRMRERR